VRLRIVQAFLGRSDLTTAALRELLPDVPVGSLYRQVAMLVDANVLTVVAERRVRGAVERTYALDLAVAQVSLAELADLTTDDHRRLFMVFVAGLLGDFDRYLDTEQPDLVADHAGYFQNALWLTDSEHRRLQRRLGEAFAPFVTNKPSPRRRRRLVSFITLPAGSAQ
jgi:hypothetical protein